MSSFLLESCVVHTIDGNGVDEDNRPVVKVATEHAHLAPAHDQAGASSVVDVRASDEGGSAVHLDSHRSGEDDGVVDQVVLSLNDDCRAAGRPRARAGTLLVPPVLAEEAIREVELVALCDAHADGSESVDVSAREVHAQRIGGVHSAALLRAVELKVVERCILDKAIHVEEIAVVRKVIPSSNCAAAYSQPATSHFVHPQAGVYTVLPTLQIHCCTTVVGAVPDEGPGQPDGGCRVQCSLERGGAVLLASGVRTEADWFEDEAGDVRALRQHGREPLCGCRGALPR
eukprot:7234056-Prymnesium_polylepis.2